MQAGDWALLALDREALGHVELDVEAPAGVTVDLGYAEHLTDAEGRAGFSAGRVMAVKQATFSADRYVTAQGRQQHTTFDARGFRFVHVVARGPLTLHRLGVRDATYPAAQVGRFACSDDLLTRIWEVGAHTARLCMEDAFTDCPWRERGQWVGDLKITYLTNLASLGDHRVMARGLRQFALSQGADGHVNGLFPIPWQGGRIAEYSLIWCMAVRDYVHYSGDVATAHRLWPHVARALAFFETRLTPEGLTYTRQPWADLILSGAVAAEDTGEVGPLIDWVKTERVGALTTVNAFFYRALRDAAEIGSQVGEGEAAARYGALADRVADAINRLLWDAGRGIYADARRDGALSPLATVHGNSLLLAFGVAPPARWRAMCDFLRAELAHLCRDDPSIPTFFRQVVSPYFMYYVLRGLFAIGQGRYALDQIRAKWGHMLQTGTTTFWENFDPDTSLCHGWASSPTWFLSREVLGVTPAAGAGPVRVAPRTCGLAWASGTIPTPGGPVTVEWRDQGEALSLRVALPAGRGVAIESEKPLADVAVNGAAIITPDGALPDVEVAPDRRRATYPHPHGPA
ncbi:MAG: family 78 glycoside hydrolase catalytic domain [Anaerolineae bacterium]|nr:family 78 glycoside hydrolase catalytic domain [Anaerolineae bacterium]